MLGMFGVCLAVKAFLGFYILVFWSLQFGFTFFETFLLQTDPVFKCSIEKKTSLQFWKCRLSFCLSVCPSVCLSVCVSVCLSVCPSVCLSVCVSFCLYANTVTHERKVIEMFNFFQIIA
jgi:hypothetical protein